MMDFHILVVISCVVLASFASMLFINKFFRRKTFEEIIAEKKAMTDRLYAQNKATVKKPKKLSAKKELKREKKQRQKEQQRENASNNEKDESDGGHSEQPSADDEPMQGLSKTHVEFEPDPEILTFVAEAPVPVSVSRRSSNADKESALPASGGSGAGIRSKAKKDKKNAKMGILVNKNEPVAIKEGNAIEESLNSFELKQPKDDVELMKKEKEEHRQQQQQQHGGKKEKIIKSKQAQAFTAPVEASGGAMVEPVTVPVLRQEEKVRHASPKAHATTAAGSKAKQTKKQQLVHKDSAGSKVELIQAIEKLADTDTIGVSLLMNLFRRAELNRSEIQILIDYLLNKQQDMPVNHAEWSDDVCQKLKRQLEEKERALSDEQEASLGIQAKLRELRAEINNERAQMTANMKAFTEKLQAKELELSALNQELQAANEKLSAERQQFQAKLLREKQSGTQDLMQQLQLMQSEMTHKDNCIADLTRMVNASRQAVEESQQRNDIIQQQVQQIRALELQRDELEQMSNNQVFELEKLKTLETENAELKVEVRNLQNAIESVKSELDSITNGELALLRNELNEKQNLIQMLNAQNGELSQQLTALSNQTEKRMQGEAELTAALDAQRSQLIDQERQLSELSAKNTELLNNLAEVSSNAQDTAAAQQELHKLIEKLQNEIAGKHKQLLDVEQQTAEKFINREKELLQQLHDQKEKNNDLRVKNWKLVEALQSAEMSIKKNKNSISNANANLVQQEQLITAAQRAAVATTNANSAEQAEKLARTQAEQESQNERIRELIQRLYPEAVSTVGIADANQPFDRWLENVLTIQREQSNRNGNVNVNAITFSNKSTQSIRTATNSVSSNTTSSNSNSNSNSNNSHHSNHNNALPHANSNNNNNTNNDNLVNNNNNNDSELTKTTTTSAASTAANANSRISDSNTNSATSSSTTSDPSTNNTNNNNNSSNNDLAEVKLLHAQNTQLRLQIDELTKLVTKTSNTLSMLEGRAREQDEYWRNIVRTKDELISSLQHSNGQEAI